VLDCAISSLVTASSHRKDRDCTKNSSVVTGLEFLGVIAFPLTLINLEQLLQDKTSTIPRVRATCIGLRVRIPRTARYTNSKSLHRGGLLA